MITVSVVGEASLKDNTVLVDYTELKELVKRNMKYETALMQILMETGVFVGTPEFDVMENLAKRALRDE